MKDKVDKSLEVQDNLEGVQDNRGVEDEVSTGREERIGTSKEEIEEEIIDEIDDLEIDLEELELELDAELENTETNDLENEPSLDVELELELDAELEKTGTNDLEIETELNEVSDLETEVDTGNLEIGADLDTVYTYGLETETDLEELDTDNLDVEADTEEVDTGNLELTTDEEEIDVGDMIDLQKDRLGGKEDNIDLQIATLDLKKENSLKEEKQGRKAILAGAMVLLAIIVGGSYYVSEKKEKDGVEVQIEEEIQEEVEEVEIIEPTAEEIPVIVHEDGLETPDPSYLTESEEEALNNLTDEDVAKEDLDTTFKEEDFNDQGEFIGEYNIGDGTKALDEEITEVGGVMTKDGLMTVEEVLENGVEAGGKTIVWEE